MLLFFFLFFLKDEVSDSASHLCIYIRITSKIILKVCLPSLVMDLTSSSALSSYEYTEELQLGLRFIRRGRVMVLKHICDQYPNAALILNGLTAHNWQKRKRVFLTFPCHKIYRDEEVGLKSCKYTWKITIFVKMWNLGNIL